MKYKIRINHRGFIALSAVVILFAVIINFSILGLATAVVYADSVYRKELRIQSCLNADSCRQYVILMISRDYFINGQISIPEFGCNIAITNNNKGKIHFELVSKLAGIQTFMKQEVLLDDKKASWIED